MSLLVMEEINKSVVRIFDWRDASTYSGKKQQLCVPLR